MGAGILGFSTGKEDHAVCRHDTAGAIAFSRTVGEGPQQFACGGIVGPGHALAAHEEDLPATGVHPGRAGQFPALDGPEDLARFRLQGQQPVEGLIHTTHGIDMPDITSGATDHLLFRAPQDLAATCIHAQQVALAADAAAHHHAVHDTDLCEVPEARPALPEQFLGTDTDRHGQGHQAQQCIYCGAPCAMHRLILHGGHGIDSSSAGAFCPPCGLAAQGSCKPAARGAAACAM